jgi:MFS family permease
LFGPFAAAFMNRFGLRRVMICAAMLIVVGLLASLAMTRVWQLILLWGVVVGVGTGLTAIVLAATVATRWFTKRRGLVVGLLTASSATGQLIFLPLIAELTERFGWRWALIFVCGLLAAAGLVALALMRDRPSDLNLPALRRDCRNAAAAGRRRPDVLAARLRLRCSRTRPACRCSGYCSRRSSFAGRSTNGLIQTHFITLCGDYGLAGGGRGERARHDGRV